MNSSLFWVMARVDGRLVLNLEELADALGIAVQTAYNDIDEGTFPIPLRKHGREWLADARDVAEYLDLVRSNARAAHDLVQARLNASPSAATGTGRRRKNGGPPSPPPDVQQEAPSPEAMKRFEESVRELGERWQLSMSPRRAGAAKMPDVD